MKVTKRTYRKFTKKIFLPPALRGLPSVDLKPNRWYTWSIRNGRITVS